MPLFVCTGESFAAYILTGKPFSFLVFGLFAVASFLCSCVGCRLAPLCVLWLPFSWGAARVLRRVAVVALGCCLCLYFVSSLVVFRCVDRRLAPLCVLWLPCLGCSARPTAGCRVRPCCCFAVCVCVCWSVGLGRSVPVGRSVGRVCVCGVCFVACCLSGFVVILRRRLRAYVIMCA